MIAENFIFLNLDNKCRTEFEMNVTREAVVVDMGGSEISKTTSTVIMTQNKGSHPKHYFFFFSLFFFPESSV